MFFLLLKRLLTRIFFPVSLGCIGLTVCCLLLCRSRTGARGRRAGRILLVAITCGLVAAGHTGGFWLGIWCGRYRPLAVEDLPRDRRYVVAIAGNRHVPDRRIPPECRFSGHMLLRLGEGVRIARRMERLGLDYEIVVSSFSADGPDPGAEEAVKAFFREAGVPAGRVSLVQDAMNSRQEVKAFGRRRGTLVLVSNAYHVPRLMLLARKYRLDALPAPADFADRAGTPRRSFAPYPSSRNLDDLERLCYELLGCLETLVF